MRKAPEEKIKTELVEIKASTSQIPKPVGLENLENTCYLSAVLQILFKIIPVEFKDRAGTIMGQFFELKEQTNKDNYWTLIQTIAKEIPIVDDEGQQDAQEFLMAFINLLNDEITEIEKIRIVERKEKE